MGLYFHFTPAELDDLPPEMVAEMDDQFERMVDRLNDEPPEESLKEQTLYYLSLKNGG